LDHEFLTSHLGEMTELLRQLDAGDPEAEEIVFRKQFKKLRQIASQILNTHGVDLSLVPSEIVQEFYLRFKNQDMVTFTNTEHFLNVARKKMREVVWDYARARKAQKRPTSFVKVSIDDVLTDFRLNGLVTADAQPDMILFLEEILGKLGERNQRDADIVDLYYFIGLSHSEIAKRYSVTEDAIKKRLQFVRAWLNVQSRAKP